ncbi:molybdopterin synthase catalytic subunit isoform X1 [Cricetulus griseus]|uniref:Molybdopterin synthase catalytic subunit n=1 Tax=Cricetulus griseus TaxID=10029 RepID=A0A9J7FHW7_CRIGR|nr:molybdopterin synthase catalytic subunit isoform X1 [Cricetulus griseus]XP_027257231.1 molybdopterin synthase catalytic subunit isoform X1 [Cricetulus griseus]ERE82541.1 molybdopterin synthase catalytic subunit-like isoform 1 [Cricetulus griseus]
MSSLEISNSCFSPETKLPLSPQLVEDSASEPSRKSGHGNHIKVECVASDILAEGCCCLVSREDVDEVEEKPKDIIQFSAKKLSVDEVSQLVISPLCGAVSLFVGTTRNNFEGKKVISLEYEAYLPMAENEIRKICSDIRQKWPVRHIAVFHRLGLVPVSEASTIIAVSSAHRAASLEAVSYAIDSLKAKVPIWKKEIYEESASSWKRNKECFWAAGD